MQYSYIYQSRGDYEEYFAYMIKILTLDKYDHCSTTRERLEYYATLVIITKSPFVSPKHAAFADHGWIAFHDVISIKVKCLFRIMFFLRQESISCSVTTRNKTKPHLEHSRKQQRGCNSWLGTEKLLQGIEWICQN